jgi:hypothetical protein
MRFKQWFQINEAGHMQLDQPIDFVALVNYRSPEGERLRISTSAD